MNYPTQLITDYRSGKITRAQFCNQWAKNQNIDYSVKGTADKSGVYVQYRGHKAQIRGSVMTWYDNGVFLYAQNIREFIAVVDYREAHK